VVIAIIGILAAMVFPVFARARESARKAVCLSNVKNIALAVNMYLADNNDTLPPTEHRQEAIDYFAAVPGGSSDYTEGPDWCLFQSNPYLRWPLVFDEYVKNRDVWRCPSAKVEGGASWIIWDPDWLTYLRQHEGEWGAAGDYLGGACFWSYPSGWGGTVTDTILQGRFAVPEHGDLSAGSTANRSFRQSIGTQWNPELKMAAVQDAANYLIVSDKGSQAEDANIGMLAYPELCALECGNCAGWVDWQTCTWAVDCGLYAYAPNDGSFIRNREYLKPYSRHLGGVNIGFLDGHASWINSQTLLQRLVEGEIQGGSSWGATSLSGWGNPDCGFTDPILY